MFSSWVLERIAIGDTHRLRTGITSVGRHSSSLIRILDSHYVSRHHAEIEVSGDDQTVTIKDLNSVNGIFVNTNLHQSVTVSLSIGDKIGIGVSVDGTEEEDELTLPIYELKYLPIARARSSAVQNIAPLTLATQPNNRIKIENDNLPSTSRKVSNTPKPQIIHEILIISDDDGDDRNDNGPKKPTEEIKGYETEKINNNIIPQDIKIKQEKISNAISMQSTNINKGDTLKTTEAVMDESSISTNKLLPEKKVPLAEEIKTLPESSKEPSLHIPIISSLKKELIHSVSVDLTNIFGDIDDDDDMKNKLKEINPFVYNELTGKPLLPVTHVDKHIMNGDCITLSDDDALEEDDLGVVIPATSKSINEHNHRMETTRSPNIFDTSLNDSKDDDQEEQNITNNHKIVTTTINQQNVGERLTTTTDNVDLEDYIDAGDEDLEELMFSQVLINDMKAELQNDVFNADFEDELPQNEVRLEEALELPIKIKQEPDLERNASLLNEIENSCWVISDDEDYDAELETKVSDWSNKIFSQSFSNINMSQVYDLDSGNMTDDYEDQENGDDDVDFNIIDDDIDNIADLYNNNEREEENNIDKDLQSFKERLNNETDESQDEENEQEKVETCHENDLGVNEQIIVANNLGVSNESIFKLQEIRTITATHVNEISGPFKDAKLPEKIGSTLQNNNSIKEKCPDGQQEVNDQEKVDIAHGKELGENRKIVQVKNIENISKNISTLNENSAEIFDDEASEDKKISVEDNSIQARFKLKELRIVINSSNAMSEAFKDGKFRANTGSTLRSNDSFVVKKYIKDNSPDIEMLHQATETNSPLIRLRRKSFNKARPVSPSSSEDEEDFLPGKPTSAENSNNDKCQPNETAINKSNIRQPPMIIDAPALPKCKGKLRGISAVKPQPILANNTKPSNQSLISIRDKIICDRTMKDQYRKWLEKSSVSRKCDKERKKMIKESRKDKLKELAEKHKGPTNDTLKRKGSVGIDHEEVKAKKAKVKVTTNNRGAFLANADQPQSKPRSKGSFKIPKVACPKPEDTKKDHVKDSNEIAAKITCKEPIKRSSSTDEIKKKEPIKRTNSIDASFSQQISMADELLIKKVSGDFKKPDTRPLPPKRSALKSNSVNSNISSSHVTDTKGAVCKEAVAARALRTTNKITFASMEKNLTDTAACKEKLNTISNIRCGENIPSSLANTGTVRPKKTVRFNEVPVIHYIERICGASRRVIGKDILPQTTNKDRRLLVRRNFPIIDNTDKVISKILHWSNEWLIKRDAAADAASEVVYPMPTHFSSFDHYKSVLFPLMKLEFASLLERQYKLTLCTKKYTVKMEYVTENKDRLMLVTKFLFDNRQQLDNTRFDLVILESKQMNNSMFAYLTSVRKGAGTCNTMVFEILPINITKDFFIGIKEFTVRPVIDNVRVEFGAFNAVYQLEATPLFQKVLNPLELLQCRHAPKKKPIYRGCDELNEKQKQVLLNTYTRIIDETTPNISLLQGPPGTGKSCVITNLALQTLYGDEVRYLDKKILICAQSNAAVDVIAGKLYNISMRMRTEKRFRLIRYGLPEKINPSVNPVSLIHLVERELLRKLKIANSSVQVENKESLKNQILQLEAQIAEMTRRNVKGTVEEDMLLEKQQQLHMMRNISNQLTRPEDERSLYSWYLSNANVVCATLSSCVKLSQYVNYFDICIIDEATQSTEPWTLLPLRFGINSLVLVGDTQQLPATILSKKANELGLGKSMFTRIQNCLDNVPSGATGGNAVTTPGNIIFGLQTQYRMNPEICRWPNAYFYRNELINGRITMEYKSPLMPFSVLNLAYTQNEYCSNGKITNNLEAEFVAKLLKALDGFIPNKYNSYGVITPYAHHRTTLENSIRSLGLTNIMVNTIDSYQGLEKDVIVISNARTSGIGFLSNPQRLNVALTRPKKCLILCGNFKSLEIVPAWRCLLQSARERNLYYEISTNCVNDIQTNVIDKIRLKK